MGDSAAEFRCQRTGEPLAQRVVIHQHHADTRLPQHQPAALIQHMHGEGLTVGQRLARGGKQGQCFGALHITQRHQNGILQSQGIEAFSFRGPCPRQHGPTPFHQAMEAQQRLQGLALEAPLQSLGIGQGPTCLLYTSPSPRD